MTLKLLTAAAVMTTAIAAPALADPHARSEPVQLQQQRAQAHARMYYRHNDFWPGDLAAGVVGGAIGTAGAIATAPFRYDSYAYNGYYGPDGYNGPYGYSSGFVCRPGATFIGEDGLRHLCQ
jgi:hypothetical protein